MLDNHIHDIVRRISHTGSSDAAERGIGDIENIGGDGGR